MLTNAKLKRIESDHAGIAAAMHAYQDRFLQLPGDDDSADTRFVIFNGQANINGDGDGIVSGNWIAAADTETSNFWKHLRAAGLVSGGGNDATQPTNAYGGNIGVRSGSLLIAGHVTVFGSIEGSIAAIIEARLDDGNPRTGRIQSYVDTNRYFMAFQM